MQHLKHLKKEPPEESDGGFSLTLEKDSFAAAFLWGVERNDKEFLVDKSTEDSFRDFAWLSNVLTSAAEIPQHLPCNQLFQQSHSIKWSFTGEGLDP